MHGKTKIVLVLTVVIGVVLAVFLTRKRPGDEGSVPSGKGGYRHIRWYDDGSVDVITFEDKEVIHLNKDELGSMFGQGRKPFAGKRIAITVNNSGPKGGISGPLYRLRPAW